MASAAERPAAQTCGGHLIGAGWITEGMNEWMASRRIEWNRDRQAASEEVEGWIAGRAPGLGLERDMATRSRKICIGVYAHTMPCLHAEPPMKIFLRSPLYCTNVSRQITVKSNTLLLLRKLP